MPVTKGLETGPAVEVPADVDEGHGPAVGAFGLGASLGEPEGADDGRDHTRSVPAPVRTRRGRPMRTSTPGE